MKTRIINLILLLCAVSARAQAPLNLETTYNGLTQNWAAGAIVQRGQLVIFDATGRVIPATTSTTSGIFGVAVTNSGNSGQSVLISIEGTPLVVVDGTCVQGNAVSVSSTTAGYGHCSALASATTQVIGYAVNAGAANGFVNVALSISASGSSSGGGGLTPVATLPTTCTAGAQYLITGSGQIVTCSATNTFALGGTLPGTVNPTAYGAKYNAHFNAAPTFTNTLNTVTCTGCNFTGTDIYGRPIASVGQVIFGSNTTTDVSQATSTFITPECGIATIVSATQITMGVIGSLGTACNATATTSASGYIFWGNLDSNTTGGGAQTAANDPIYGAWTAAATNCLPFHHPAGVTFIERQEWNTYPSTAGSCGSQNSLAVTRQGFTITGEGDNASIVIITPNFSATNECTGPNGTSIGCLVSLPNPILHDWQIWGAGNSAGGLSGKAAVLVVGLSPGINFEISRMQMNGWGAATAGFYGINVGNGVSSGISGGNFHTTNIEAFGYYTCYLNPGTNATFTVTIYADQLWCNVGATALTVNSGIFSSTNGLYGWTTVSYAATGAVNSGSLGVAFSCQNAAFCNSNGDSMPYNGVSANGGPQYACLAQNSAVGPSICHITNSTLISGGTSAIGIVLYGQPGGSASPYVSVSNSYVSSTYTIYNSNCVVICRFNSLGGNTFIATNTGYTNAAGAQVMFAPTDTFSGFGTTIQPTCTFSTGGGTTPSCSTSTGSTNEKGVIIATTGTGAPGSTGTITLGFVGTFSGGTASAPACTYTLDNSGTAWGNEAVSFVSTQSTTAPGLAWSNVATAVLTALATSSPYRIDYTCTAR